MPRAIVPADLTFPTLETTAPQRFQVRAMRASAKEFEIVDTAQGIAVRDHMHRDLALDTAAALDLAAAQGAEDPPDAATAAAAALGRRRAV